VPGPVNEMPYGKGRVLSLPTIVGEPRRGAVSFTECVSPKSEYAPFSQSLEKELNRTVNLSQPTSRATTGIPARFDTVTKRVVQRNPKAFIQNVLALRNAEEIEILETEQLTLRTHRADSFFRVKMNGKPVIVHCEFQTHDSTDIPMPFRMVGYIGRGVELHRLPIYSYVIYLHPRAGLTDPGEYRQELAGHNIFIQYRVIRLSEMEGQAILAANQAGLLSFASLMKPPADVDAPQWLRQCVEAVETSTQDASRKDEYLAELAVLAGLVYESQTIRDLILEEIMQESSIIQYFTQQATQQGRQQGIEQGRQQGARESTIEAIVEALEIRFQPEVARLLQPALEAIDDLQHLKRLRREAMQTPTLEEFMLLAANGETKP